MKQSWLLRKGCQGACGIAVCGSGVGACIVANKVPGVRASLINDAFSAHQVVEDDNMNLNRADKVVKRIVAGKGTGGGHLTYAGGQIPLRKGTASECKSLKRLVERRFLKSIGVSADRCSRLLTKSERTVQQ